MKTVTWVSFLSAMAITSVAITIINHYPGSRVVVYNCSIAEISPDVPIKVKEQCRRINADRYNK
jgi:hypothetical protein